MLLLSFSVGNEEYAVDSRRIVEVLPLVPVRPIPHAPAHLRGVFVHRGRLVPVVDMGLLLAGRPLREALGSRIIVAEFDAGGGGAERIGIGAERVLSLRPDTAIEARLRPPVTAAPCLGELLRIEGRTIQLIAVEHLLPRGLADAAAPPAAGAS